MAVELKDVKPGDCFGHYAFENKDCKRCIPAVSSKCKTNTLKKVQDEFDKQNISNENTESAENKSIEKKVRKKRSKLSEEDKLTKKVYDYLSNKLVERFDTEIKEWGEKTIYHCNTNGDEKCKVALHKDMTLQVTTPKGKVDCERMCDMKTVKELVKKILRDCEMPIRRVG